MDYSPLLLHDQRVRRKRLELDGASPGQFMFRPDDDDQFVAHERLEGQAPLGAGRPHDAELQGLVEHPVADRLGVDDMEPDVDLRVRRRELTEQPWEHQLPGAGGRSQEQRPRDVPVQFLAHGGR